jgi:hypothetical protein
MKVVKTERASPRSEATIVRANAADVVASADWEYSNLAIASHGLLPRLPARHHP